MQKNIKVFQTIKVRNSIIIQDLSALSRFSGDYNALGGQTFEYQYYWQCANGKVACYRNGGEPYSFTFTTYDTEFVLTHSQLKEQHPEIFATKESKKRLYFATRLVLHKHSARRSRHGKQIKLRSAATQKPPIITRSEKKNQQSKVESKHGAVCDQIFPKRFVVNGRNLSLNL